MIIIDLDEYFQRVNAITRFTKLEKVILFLLPSE